MKIYFEQPKDSIKYSCFRATTVGEDWAIWYEWEKVKYLAKKPQDIPDELRAFLEKWTKKMQVYKETFCELYPVKNAAIMFLYKDQVYKLFPSAVGATYESDFLTGEMHEYDWDAFLEEYQREIRDDMKKELGIEYSAYYGVLD